MFNSTSSRGRVFSCFRKSILFTASRINTASSNVHTRQLPWKSCTWVFTWGCRMFFFFKLRLNENVFGNRSMCVFVFPCICWRFLRLSCRLSTGSRCVDNLGTWHVAGAGVCGPARIRAWRRDINIKRKGQGRSRPITLHPVTAVRAQTTEEERINCLGLCPHCRPNYGNILAPSAAACTAVLGYCVKFLTGFRGQDGEGWNRSHCDTKGWGCMGDSVGVEAVEASHFSFLVDV